MAIPEPDPASSSGESLRRLSETTESPEAVPAVARSEPKRPRRILRRIMWVLLVLAVLAAVGWAVVYGWPLARDRYVQPVEDNTEAISALDGRVADLENRLAEIDSGRAEVAALLDPLVTGQGDLESRLDGLDDLVAAHGDKIDDLERLASELEMDASQAASDRAAEVDLLKALELLSRARLFLFEANYGLAEQDIALARDILASEGAGDPAVPAEALVRLDFALAALPDRPVVAAVDLDGAWQALLDVSAENLPAQSTASTTSTTTP